MGECAQVGGVSHLPMTRTLTRTHFHSSRLVRILSDLALVEPVGAGGAFAEKLGQWVDIAGAISLRAAQTAIPAGAHAGMPSVAAVSIGEEFARMRAALEDSITRRGLPMGAATDYEPYRRYYFAHQRDMDLNVCQLRVKVRARLAKASPALKQLADLDAALDAILSERESKLFSKVPLLLERRFAQLLKAHQQRLVATQQADNPAFWMKPGGWLARFCHELQTVLLAELDVRLQPTLGLIEAFNNEITKHK